MLAPSSSTILIVEDDAGIAELEKLRLEEAGYDILIASTADEALTTIRHATVHLILLDYRLPGDVNGLDFYARVKEVGSDVPVILVTGFGNEATVIKAMRMGIRDFVTKSMEYLDYLPEAVNRVLKQVSTEHQLAESEAQLASIIANATDAILVTDVFNHITLFNAAAEAMFGCSAGVAIGQSILRFIPPDVAADSSHDVWSVPNFLKLSSRAVRANGDEFPIEASQSLHEAAGKKYRTVVVRDITERKRTEEALENERQFLNALLESMHSGIIACDAEGKLTVFNQKSREIHNLPEHLAPHLCMIAADDLHHPDGKTRLKKEEMPLFRALHGEIVRDVEVIVVPKRGPHRTLLVNGRPIHMRDGRNIGAVVSVNDVTEQKRLVSQLQQAQRMEAIGALAGGVAHDFNNLLTVINGYSEMVLASKEISSNSLDLVRQILRAGEQAASLTRQLLAFSRKQVIAPRVLDLNVLIREVEKMLRRLIGADISLTATLDPTLGQVKADPAQMEQIIMNLVVNARDAMPTGGRLTIETRNITLDDSYSERHVNVKPGKYLLLAVSDTGIGIDEVNQLRIFEPFFTTKSPGKGTGLGLATVHGVVQQSGGHIEVYSEVGKGTTFKVYLPRTQDLPVVASPSSVSEVPRGTETILLAEDDDDIRTLARIALQSYGYTILDAADGASGLKIGMSHDHPIDLLITDVVMPKMSGRELVERLRPHHADMKILYMSGYTDDAIVRHGILESDVAFLQKPFTPTILARKVREVLNQKSTVLSRSDTVGEAI